MNMLLCKTQAKGNFTKKILKGQLIPNASLNQMTIVTENSIEVQVYEYEAILNQYTASILFSQSFPFLILDSAIMSSDLLLLTVCGLVLLTYSNGSFAPIDNIQFNTSGEPRDIIMYLKANSSGEVVIAYSNTNLFFVYSVKNNKLIRKNSSACITNFNICKAFLIKLTSSFGVFLFTKSNKEYDITTLFIDSASDSPVMTEEYSTEMKQYSLLMSSITTKLNSLSSIDDADVYDLVFSSQMNHIFLISEVCLIIHKVVSCDKLDNLCKIDFKTPRYFVSSLTLSSDFIQLTFDTKVFLFKVEGNELKRCRVRPKEAKSKVAGFNSLLLIPESMVVLHYDCNSSLVFSQYTPLISNEEINLKLISEYVNESLFAFDSAMLSSEDRHSIYAVCGLKGNSRLVKYEEAFNETKLKEMRLLNVNNIFISSSSSNVNRKLCLFSYIDKASLFAIRKDFTIDFIKEFDDNIVDVYPIPNSNERFALVFKRSVVIIQLDDCNSGSMEIEETPLSKPVIKSQIEIPLNEKHAIILSSSYYCQFSNVFYLICYLSSNEIAISSIASAFKSIKEESRLNLGEAVSIASLSSLNISMESQSSFSFLIGTYQSYLQLIQYNVIDKAYDIRKENKYDIVPNDSSGKIVTESIKSIDNFIFISTRTGEFCGLLYDNSTKKLNCFLSNKFTSNHLCLRISSVLKTSNGYSLDLFNELSAFNLSITTNPSIKVFKKKYIIKREEGNIQSENNAIVFFTRMPVNAIDIHLYQNGSNLSFAFFSGSDEGMMLINDIYHFNTTETARRMLALANELLLVLTDANRLYLYSPSQFKCISEVRIDLMPGLIIHSMKKAAIAIPNESNKAIEIICLCGEYNDIISNTKKGILIIYEYNQLKGGLNVIAKVPKFPKAIYDVCCTKNYFVTGMEGYMCLLPYEIDSQTFGLVLKKEAKQMQYMNRLISLQSIDTDNCNTVLVGDYRESFQLIDFEINQARFDVSAAEMSNRSLAKALPLRNSREEVMLFEKNCSLSLFKLNNDLYDLSSSIDLKEYITNLHQSDEGYLCTGLLGSMYLIKPFTQKLSDEFGLTAEAISALLTFQSEVIAQVAVLYFGSELPIEKMLQMSCPLKNVLLLDLLYSLCKNHPSLIQSIPGHSELYKLLIFIIEEVI